MRKRRQNWQKKYLVLIIVIASAVLYFTGVLSGLYANKLTEERTTTKLSLLKNETYQDITMFKQGTSTQLTNLNQYIMFLETNLNSMQIQQEFLSSLSQEERCRFSNITTEYLIGQLQYYREQLPYRLEEYEKKNKLSTEYQVLKQQYNTLSLRTWIIMRKNTCDKNLVRVLYFYNAECELCVEQGEHLDLFTTTLEQKGKKVALFAIDANANDVLIRFIREYYQLEEVPAIIVNEAAYQGFVWTAEELARGIE